MRKLNWNSQLQKQQMNASTDKKMNKEGTVRNDRLYADWKFSLQLFGGYNSSSFIDSGKFNTAGEFWAGIEMIPSPAQLLMTKEGGREAQAIVGNDKKENVRGVILSRFPVTLEWKYPGMKYIYEMEEHELSDRELNQMYEDACVNIVGEKYPSLLGFRLLDRSKKGSAASHRFEYWCNGSDDNLEAMVKHHPRGKVKKVSE